MPKPGLLWLTVGLLATAMPMTGPQPARPVTPDSVKAEIEALRAPKVAWREIVWKSCLLEGLAEARAAGKPALLWIFIDRPTDDARC